MNPRNEIFLKFAEPGHFYSPLPDLDELDRERHNIFGPRKTELPGIHIDADAHRSFIREAGRLTSDMPFQENQVSGYRYFYNNPFFSYGDAIIAYAMVKKHRPSRIVEIGSGFSSALLLDCSDINFDGRIQFDFVDPYPERLEALLNPDEKNCVVHKQRSQDIDISLYKCLSANDILFIDSSHVAKIGSDVIDHLNRILPSLEPGVVIHFHDIFWPFEYPEEWIFQGRAWNEAYMLRAFLQYNTAFEILFFSSYASLFCQRDVQDCIPNFTKNTGGSLWLRKTKPLP